MDELKIIHTALESTGLVIVVSSISKSASLNRRKLEYISPNAAMLGMNIDALKQGYRLIDDYVHPDDRQRFNEAVTMSLSSGKDFSYEVRHIGDDGSSRPVNVDIIHLPDQDDTKFLEFVIREVPKHVQVSSMVDEEGRVDIEDIDIDQNFLKSNNIERLINSFASSSELYSVMMDINGKPLIDPVGPPTYLGEFHEMVYNPSFNQLYEDMIACIVDSKQAVYSEIDDGNPDSRFAAAPIFINGRFYATWILYAHTKTQNQKLFKAFDHISTVAKVLSDIISKLYIGSAIYSEEEEMKSELDFEKNGKEIMTKILKIVAEGDKSNVLEIYENVGTLLDVDYIVYYAVDHDNPGKMKLVDYWARSGKGPEAEAVFVWDNDHYDLDIQNKIKEDGLIVDKKNMTNKMRVEVFQGNCRAVMVFPVKIADEYEGRMIFIENSRERIWKKSEISFAREVTDMISRDLSIEKRVKRSRRGTKILQDLFDELSVYLFVRRVDNGRVIYVNPALKEKMGYDMTGENSFMLIPNVKEEFEGMDVATKEKIHNGKEYYKRYINKLGGNYDVVEYFMRWKDGEKVAVLIMTPEE